ncbi:hypothetical protein BS329_35160 [Amycolatopsis coloradensis]|uniref:Uncharacterized protein n=1 Tax=Amycolatopsis coloradensis TaxID=76021 RepID=A0A1R0KH50_9PSEU|nr:hypothetical protein [Amycolatopsis coloradensis]OLZ44995.1 hypothetical protein BS329_35160 [Amycolatopsis coloradensis]
MREVAEHPKTSAEEVSELRRAGAPKHCGWCGRRLEQGGNVGRRRRYCGQSCRQRAYERRTALQRSGLPEDAVVLSDTEIATLQDRLFQLRCAAEDIVTAADDGASLTELRGLADEIAQAAKDLEQLR